MPCRPNGPGDPYFFAHQIEANDLLDNISHLKKISPVFGGSCQQGPFGISNFFVFLPYYGKNSKMANHKSCPAGQTDVATHTFSHTKSKPTICRTTYLILKKFHQSLGVAASRVRLEFLFFLCFCPLMVKKWKCDARFGL